MRSLKKIKNNLNTTNQDKGDQRRVFAMDLVEKPNLGEKLIQLYKSQLNIFCISFNPPSFNYTF